MQLELADKLVSAGVGYALKYVVDEARTRFIRDRLLGKAWAFLEDPTHIFLPVTNSPDGAAAGYGDLLAMSRIIGLAARSSATNRSLTIHPDQTDFRSVEAENLIVIGGGKHNSVYRELVETLRVPLHFFDTATESFREIRNKDGSQVYSPVTLNGVPTVDLGLLVRAKNPHDTKKWIVIGAGSYTYGSVAAIQFLLESRTLREVRKHFDQNFEVIVKGTVENHSISHVRSVSSIVDW